MLDHSVAKFILEGLEHTRIQEKASSVGIG